MKHVLLLLIAPALASCGATMPTEAQAAVVDYAFQSKACGCLSVDSQDPDKDLMQAIAAGHPQIYVQSACIKSDMMYLTPDGQRTDLVMLGGWRRLSPWYANTWVIHDSNFMFGTSVSKLTLKKINGKWTVTDETVESIS